jgi:multicomponent Na+:H+ antiporter subunit C
VTSSLALIVLCGVLVAVGVYLILERTLSRIVLGIASLSNGINILFLIAGGHSGEPAFFGQADAEDMADPLVQAMMLTSIVITLALTGFLLAMAYRSWQLRDHDEVRDDREDRLVARRLAQVRNEDAVGVDDLAEASAEFHDDVDTGEGGIAPKREETAVPGVRENQAEGGGAL